MRSTAILFIICLICCLPCGPWPFLIHSSCATDLDNAILASPSVDNNESADRLFREEIVPLVLARCVVCHGGESVEGGYSLASFSEMLQTGDSQLPPLVFGMPEASELLRRLISEDPEERMPAHAQPLDELQIQAFRKWIEAGSSLTEKESSLPLAELVSSEALHVAPESYPRPLAIHSLALNADASQILVGGYGEVTIWDRSNGRLLHRIPTLGRHVAAIDLSQNERWLTISSGSPGQTGTVQIVDLKTSASPRQTLLRLNDVTSAVAFSPDGQQLAIGGSDGILRVAQVGHTSPGRLSTFALHADAILAIAWSADGKRLLTAARDRTAKLLESANWNPIVSYDRHERAVGGVAFLGNRTLTLDETGQLRLMEGNDSDRSIAEQAGLLRQLQPIAVHDDDTAVVAGKSLLHLFRLNHEKVDDGQDSQGKTKTKTVTRLVMQTHSLETTAWITRVAARNETLVLGTQDGEVFVYNFDGTLLQHFIAKP